MKKYRISLLITLILLFSVGCEKKDTLHHLECTKLETDEDGFQTDSTISVFSNKDKVFKIDAKIVSEMEEDMINFSVTLGESLIKNLNEISGIQVSYEKVSTTKIQYKMLIDLENLDLDSFKSKVGEALDEEKITSMRNISLKDFQKNYLTGFQCLEK